MPHSGAKSLTGFSKPRCGAVISDRLCLGAVIFFILRASHEDFEVICGAGGAAFSALSSAWQYIAMPILKIWSAVEYALAGECSWSWSRITNKISRNVCYKMDLSPVFHFVHMLGVGASSLKEHVGTSCQKWGNHSGPLSFIGHGSIRSTAAGPRFVANSAVALPHGPNPCSSLVHVPSVQVLSGSEGKLQARKIFPEVLP